MNRQATTVAVLIGALLGAAVVGGVTIGGEPATPIDNGVPLGASDGPSVTVYGDVNASLTDYTTANSVEVITDAGNVTLSSNGGTQAAVFAGTNLTGTWTNVTGITAGGTELTIDPADKPPVRTLGDTDQLSIRDSIAVDDGTTDLYVEGPNAGTATVTITDGHGLPADTFVVALDQQTGELLDSATTGPTGAVTFDIPTSSHPVVLQTDAGKTAPTISGASPVGVQGSQPSQLQATIDDSDFPGDTVSYEIRFNGSTQATGSLASSGTVSASIPPEGQLGGTHTWSIEAEDIYGNQRTETFQYRVPGNLTILNETSPTQKIDNAQVEVTFFGPDGQVVTQSTQTGVIDLTGLPVTEEMVIAVEADGYKPRTSYIETIYQQSRVYLAPENASTANVIYALDDKTGRFPAEGTSLRIQRPITRDRDGDGTNETRFETVAGDRFGAAGEVAGDLILNERYRLVIENQQGEQRVLGGYTVTGDDRVTLEVGAITFAAGEQDQATVFQAALEGSANSRTVTVRYADPDNRTTQLQYEVIRSDGTVLQPNTTVAGPVPSFKTTIPVPNSAPDDVSYEVRFHADRDEAADSGGLRRIGDVPEIAKDLGVDPTVLAYISFVGLVAITGLVVVFDDRLAALTAVVVATLLTTLGAISIPAPALGIAGVIALLYNVARG
jgi:hypothetical protein